MKEFVKRRKEREDELREKIKAGEADESEWDYLPLPTISYVSMTLKPVQLPD